MMSVQAMPGAATSSASNNTTNSSGAWLALLQESDNEPLQTAACQKLLQTVDTAWHQIAEALPDLEALAENTDLSQELRQTAAAVASRVFFYLEEPQQALRLALQAGPDHFDVLSTQQSPYVQRLVAAALDAYTAGRQKQLAGDTPSQEEEDVVLSMDALQSMVYRLLDAACAAGQYRHATGIALEAGEATKLHDILARSGEAEILGLCSYALKTACTTVPSKQFRAAALQVIAQLQEEQLAAALAATTTNRIVAAAHDLVVIYQLLQQPEQVAAVLKQLLADEAPLDVALLGLQLSFDLMDSANQAFCSAVASHLPAAPQAAAEEEGAAADETAAATASRMTQCHRILQGGFVNELGLSFLHKHSHADRLQMEQLKKALEERSSGSRSSVLHNSAVLTHSYLHAGTTNDSFLRDYLDWMKKASNWAKFSATASLGVVHAGHTTEAMHLLEPYLPPDPDTTDEPVSPTAGYAAGGSLYAAGLIHGSNAGSSAAERRTANAFLRRHLRASHANEVISHGAALGVGLTAMGTANVEIARELKELLDTDSAVAGEAAGIAIGLVLVGTGAGNVVPSLADAQQAADLAEIIAELKNYARETQHEKIIRGIAVGLALVNFGQEEGADVLIEEMRSDRDPIMRYGAQYAIALAYCGTGSTKAVRILLHTAVSDVSDDVRMAAVIGLAFVLFKTPERVPQLVKLLLESFNPHVRYASCMAVGIAMAGTGDVDAITLLEPMLEDMTDYVRQGALMGTAMIYMQQSDSCNGRRIKSFREKLATIVTEKHQSTLTKMGAILSTGILDAAGRNASLALGSRFGFTKMTSAVGMALWLQHWHWFPMMHMLSLALTPTFTIGLNQDFKFPKKFEIVCHAKPSAYSYPRKLEEKKEEKKKRVETVQLSTTAKEKARLARKRAKLGLDGSASGAGGASAMDVDTAGAAAGDAAKTTTDDDKKKPEGEATEGQAMEVDGEEKEGEGGDKAATDGKKPKKKRTPEPTEFRIPNPARITQAQSLVCAFDLEQRYRPIRPDENPVGIIMLTDSTPEDEEEDLGTVKSPSDEPEGELPPPEPFVWTPPPLPAPAAAVPEVKMSDADDDNAGGGETKEEAASDDK